MRKNTYNTMTTLLKTTLAALLWAILPLQLLALSPTGTLPVIYVDTENDAPITGKETYVKATYYIDPCSTDFEAVGSASAPLATEIKGRGNYTWWGFEKKPYRLKLGKKADLLGMGSNRHWALLAHADDNMAFLRNAMGFELSRRVGMTWTPEAQPVEYVLNGEYQGLYFLTETIRVGADRVDIVEQPENNTDPSTVDGGWLVEIDNYDTDPHITVTEGGDNGDYPIWFTYKSPEELSALQTSYLKEQMDAINSAIYAPDHSGEAALCELVDLTTLAKFYVVQELMDNGESFHGSCYLNRQQGEAEKWMWGPVWDFGNSFQREKGNQRIFQNPPYHQVWIGALVGFPAVDQAIKNVWSQFCATGYEGLDLYATEYIDYIREAAARDYERWPQYGNSDLDLRKNDVMSRIEHDIRLMCEWYGGEVNIPEAVYLRGDMNGWDTSLRFMWQPSSSTYVITHIQHLSETFKVATADWSTVDFGASADNLYITPGEPFALAPKGANIRLHEPLENVGMVFDPVLETLTILPSSQLGIGEMETVARDWKLDGRLVEALGSELRVYTPSGRLLSTLRHGQTAELSVGIYIIRSTAGVEKVAVR